jgi:hypothetical protein
LASELRVSPEVERLLGRPRSFAEWVARNISVFQ